MPTIIDPKQGSKAFDDAIAHLAAKYELDIAVYYMTATLSNSVEIRFKKEGWTANQTIEIGDEQLARVVSLQPIIDSIEKVIQEFIMGLGESVTGKYPFIRLWCDRHLKMKGSPLFGFPEKEIPGWAFPRNRGQNEYPKEKDVTPRVPERIAFDGEDAISEIPIEEDDEKESRRNRIKYVDDEHLKVGKKEEIMAEATKKRVVKRGKPPIDPSKVRRPECMAHGTPMQFNKTRQLWTCTTAGCTVISRPKRTEDDHSVTIGKGGVQFRLIKQDGEITLLLISDDNVAVNLTRYVNIESILDNQDIKALSQQAVEDEKDIFNIKKSIVVAIETQMMVMGAEEFAE